ncbi:hypothetical protein [Adlercreutzia mucosicola]|uniref:DUF6788 domain-containing protein n=3 Tax=Adlercreutzia mucosicola TaxID=580026 RepID=A0A6N8JP18_9ACTN|nr:hypothetical protein [Adlercreutzia mucosicola]MCR2035443.1 hypothetical protein [Adlercreutzia mucosicola]MVX61535.1 hypothetical protein [Adlercreutzia mucosicola]
MVLWGNIHGMDETNIIRDTLLEELERNERSQVIYAREIAVLPRGSVTVRMRAGHPYCYLKFREGDKVITQYVGPEEKVGDELRGNVERRRSLQDVLKRLRREHAFIEKALGRKHEA